MSELGPPPIDYYEILKYDTISYGGGWWSVLVLLREPKTGKISLSLYKFKKINDGFKKQSSFKINNIHQIEKIIGLLPEFSKEWQNQLNNDS